MLLRIITLLLFALWSGYWYLTGKVADVQKPKKKIRTRQFYIEHGIIYALAALLIIHLLGWPLVRLPHTAWVPWLGFALVIVGMGISVMARNELGANWAHSAEYQIKEQHQLVTTGIYQWIRHPIYAGISIAYVGGALVGGSMLAGLYAVLLLSGSYVMGLREETILLEYFGGEYEEYLEHSWMLVPYLL